MSQTTSSSKGPLPSRPATSQEQTIINDILKLYCLHLSEQAYSHYTSTATFHDPVSIARGLESIKSQFNGMPKLFSSSVTETCSVLSTSTPSSLELNLTQRYVFKSPLPGKKEGTEKTVNSKVTLKLDEEGKIREHVEEWDHEGLKTGEDGFMGKVQEWRKKMDTNIVEKSVSSDPSKV